MVERAAAGVWWLGLCFLLTPCFQTQYKQDKHAVQLDIRKLRGRDTPPDAPAVPVVERDAEGGGGGGLANGPLDGQTNRGSNPPPRRAPAMAHTTRPSMPLTQNSAWIIYASKRNLPKKVWCCSVIHQCGACTMRHMSTETIAMESPQTSGTGVETPPSPYASQYQRNIWVS